MKYAATAMGWQVLVSPKAEGRRVHFLEWGVGAIALPVALAITPGAKIGFALTVQPHPISVLWPPNSILLAALLLTPVRLWWVILLAAFPAHLAAQLQSSVPPAVILCWFISNSCEALIGAGCVRYLVEDPVRFDRLRTVGIFCFFAALVGPFVSSFVDAGFVALNQWGQDNYWQVWRTRFTSNVLAALTLVPFMVTWCGEGIGWLRLVRRARFLEAALLLVALLPSTPSVFTNWGRPRICAALSALPFLIWAAVRFGSRGASAAICTVTFSPSGALAGGTGRFRRDRRKRTPFRSRCSSSSCRCRSCSWRPSSKSASKGR